MIYLESDTTDPYENLAMEEYLFRTLGQRDVCCMLWQNERTIVVGRYQNTAEEINAAFVKEHGIRVVRRLSGGGAVYHDRGNLNYTIIADQASHADFDFGVFARPVVAALARLGIRAETGGRNDVMIDGKKFSGNAQYVKHGRVLHHGCIMVDSNLTDVADALRVNAQKYVSRAVKSVRSRVTTVNAELETPVGMEEFKRILAEEIRRENGNPEPYTLTDADRAAVAKLRDETYATWEWNYGASPPYDVRLERKFPAGLVTAFLHAEGETIRSVRFHGDFFGDGDIAVLERALEGIALNEELPAFLETMDVPRYMHGITSSDLAGLLCRSDPE